MEKIFTMKNLYIVFAVSGCVLPLSQFVPFVAENGLDIPLFFSQLFATRISSFFAWDVIVSAVVLVAFIVSESKRKQIKNFWLPIAGTFAVGVSFGLPLFLLQREIQRTK